ncbi:MAG: HlyD family efflux transporter periplasmic adaptor subunit [Candidatus Pedobacter colombiensis]|uniref:HlyD family efflux transporter periplasmic adaptor subunit n=1 Tax=Candidatus Pedobacter colombiensis TaxID=3121371 RepID=A0AAJ5W4U2_9SPHI|nr:HlyD family efflux transporter periplasmic adaptor subunit [Pedobacter sp.]WEK17600.1 MAG: HlyD family efflux transporter periplasmic adaptor subunit [Pedobacter sp.]
MKKGNLTKYLYLLTAGLLSACHGAAPTEDVAAPVTPVLVSYVTVGPLSESTELNAVSAYLQKSYVKANINGYVQSVRAQVGQQVAGNEILFSLITKEARAIGNAVNQLDPEFKFSGTSNIRAGQAGFITDVNHQKGDYVQDGEALAVIINKNSFVFLLDLPYEQRALMINNKTLELTLPDGEKLKGTISGTLPMVDSASQAQRVIIRVDISHPIPEGLIARVSIIKAARPNANTLPKSAVLTNETEDDFWVMKLINDSTAIKVPVKRGIENKDKVEILSPVFTSRDRIITTGNYGMADTAKVKVVKQL